ncbi:MAG: outer membrane beta-barrel protein [Pseudarcicella sp.]|nr:outer membrane beta-barrel protein [Pseudarcicella sp.]MBP6409545.1 outer membrane beta-barrel protein [Pseudarcicella sp.]
MLNKIILLIVVTFLLIPAKAQRTQLGLGAGGFNYKGDLSPSYNPKFTQLGINAFCRVNLRNDISVKTSLSVGSIKGDDAQVKDPFNQQRGLNFKTNLIELNGVMEYNFLDFKFDKHHTDWTPYLFGGLGFMNFSTNQVKSSNYSTFQMIIPYGLGVKYKFSHKWGLDFELGARKTFTDYLDNVGGEDFSLAQSQQNDYTLKDNYLYTSLTLTYTIMRLWCP